MKYKNVYNVSPKTHIYRASNLGNAPDLAFERMTTQQKQKKSSDRLGAAHKKGAFLIQEEKKDFSSSSNYNDKETRESFHLWFCVGVALTMCCILSGLGFRKLAKKISKTKNASS